MLRQAEKTFSFSYQRECKQNPWIGFMSFQHFRGEQLYSDVIVRPEANMCETEDLECYPVPEHVPQNGREEGYYPDTSVVYIRILWKEFEPEQGVFNYDFVEQIFNKAKVHGQTVAFRLMAHSTRACDDVPEWLKQLIPCPERPNGKRVKDSPTAPAFLQLFGNAIRVFGERFDTEPALAFMDISLPGAWGEGHNLHLYPDEDITKLIDIYTTVFQHTQLIGQLGLPDMIRYANRTVPVGWRGDGFGEPHHMELRYPPRVAKLDDIWKTAPISFESYWWLGEWKRQGWDLDRIIDFSLQCHISSFNAKSVPIPNEWRDKIDAWVAKMGYHFAVSTAQLPATAWCEDTLEILLCVENCGVAPIYRTAPVRFRLTNGQTEIEWNTTLNAATWFPGQATERTELILPKTLSAGVYTLELGIFADNTLPLCLCCNAEPDGDYYKLGTIQITEA